MTSEVWVADAYLRSSGPRTQGVLDLLARVEHPGPRLVVDLGCGPGNNTELIARRWPDALVIGVDSSPDMIAAARGREQPGHLEFRLGDLATWQPDEQPDVVLLNAVLQWVPGHLALLPRLAAMLAPGGIIGFQMPGHMAGEPPSGSLLEIVLDMAGEPQWRAKLDRAYHDMELLDTVGYITVLGDVGLRAEAWETRYAYPLAAGGLVEYSSGALLRPALALLTPDEAERFLAEYSRRVGEARPPRVIGGDPTEILLLDRVFAVGRS